MGFPARRLRRLRATDAMRRLVRRTQISVDDLVQPLFVCPGVNLKKPIESMTGCFHFSPDKIAEEAKEVAALGIPAVLLFGLPEKKDPLGAESRSSKGAVPEAIRQIKKTVPEMVIITDVCLCAYTDHGHCGVIKNDKIDNDATCELLGEMVLAHAKAGADMVAPSDMMDGRVGVIRKTLDDNGFSDVAIMAYSAKFASAYYGPFRDAAHCTPSSGDRKTYQMDPANSDEAMLEIELDIQEGADIVMIKPALAYMDIIYRAKQRFDVPIAAYNVSGEYMMIKDAEKAGSVDGEAVMMETLLSLKRAGADILITYFAKEAARLLRK